jgi:hypothetical protein
MSRHLIGDFEALAAVGAGELHTALLGQALIPGSQLGAGSRPGFRSLLRRNNPEDAALGDVLQDSFCVLLNS